MASLAKERIAVVEDDQAMNAQFCGYLQRANYEVTPFYDRETAECQLREGDFDLIVLDLELNFEQNAGLGIIHTLTKEGCRSPILVVSHLDAKTYKDITSQLGVWDYLEKSSTGANELISACRRLLRQQRDIFENADEKVATHGDLVVNLKDPQSVFWKKQRIRLPLTAWKILNCLVENHGQVVPYANLYKLLNYGRDIEVLRQHVRTLRSEFESFDGSFDSIVTSTGKGYMWRD